MDCVTPKGVREIILKAIAKHSGSLRGTAKFYGITHRKLGYLRDEATKDKELFELLELIRKDLKMSKSAFWDALRE